MTKIRGESARVGSQNAQRDVDDAGRSPRAFVLAHRRLEELQVTEHPEEGEERQRDQSARVLAGHAAHQFEDARVRDAIELGPELERDERIEIRALRDLALRDAEQRVKQPKRHALQAAHAARHFEQVRHAVSQVEERLLGRVLRGDRVREARAAGVVGDDRLEIALEHERAIALELQRATQRRDAPHRLARERERVAVVLRDDRRATRRTRVVARIREAREPLEQHLELEEMLLFALADEARDELLARRRLLAPETARVAQELLIRVAFAGKNAARGNERRHRHRLFEQAIELADSVAEELAHDVLDGLAAPLREERDVERDLAGRDLGDRGRVAHDGCVGVALLRCADERRAIVGDDDQPVLPERLELALVELVREDVTPKCGTKRRERAVRKHDDVRAAFVGAFELRLQRLRFARPHAHRESALRRSHDALRFFEDAIVTRHAECVRHGRRALQFANCVGERLCGGIETLSQHREQIIRRRRDEALRRAANRAHGACLHETTQNAIHGRSWNLRAHADFVARRGRFAEKRRVRARFVQAESERDETRHDLPQDLRDAAARIRRHQGYGYTRLGRDVFFCSTSARPLYPARRTSRGPFRARGQDVNESRGEQT